MGGLITALMQCILGVNFQRKIYLRFEKYALLHFVTRYLSVLPLSKSVFCSKCKHAVRKTADGILEIPSAKKIPERRFDLEGVGLGLTDF